MELPGSFAEIVDLVLVELGVLKPLIPTYGHLLVSALFPIYIGAHASLSRPSSAAKPANSKTKDGSRSEGEEEEEEGGLQKMEGLEPSDAIMFPVMAGSVLAGLYFLIKWLEDPAILNKILSWYFSQAGIIFAVAFLKDGFSMLRSFVFPSQYSAGGRIWKVDQERRRFVTASNERDGSSTEIEERRSPLPGKLADIPLPASVLAGLWHVRGVVYHRATLRAYIRSVLEVKSRLTILDVISTIIAIAVVSYFTFVAKPWWLTNFLGFSFSYGALQFMSPTTFWTGSLILSSLFFYDIYFVFFTPLMVTVAKKLDIPIKLLFPRPPGPDEDPDILSLSMLGLGDIVIPGMMIGLALRFDLYLFYKRKGALKAKSNQEELPKLEYVNATGGWGERFWTKYLPASTNDSTRLSRYEAKMFPKTYFRAGLYGYVAGMVTTLLAMQISSHAQPALLYLVPGVLGSLWLTAFRNGDVGEMWNFSDAVEDEETEKEGDKNNPEEAESSSQGLFSRIFSGKVAPEPQKDTKASDKSQKAEGSPKSKGKKSEDAKDDKKEKGDNGEIISFSISLGSTRPQAEAVTEKHNASGPAADDETLDFSSQSSSPVLVTAKESEPPAKKRKGKK